MATRSTIAMILDDGGCIGVYCHWDGYLKNNGQLLLNNYSDKKKVSDLIHHGDLSSLGPELGEKHDFNDRSKKTWCKFYTRDRGEEDMDYVKKDSYKDYFKERGEEFNYVFRGGKWFVARDSYNKNVFNAVELTQELIDTE